MSKMILNKLELKVLSEFTKDYFAKVYGRAVAKSLRMNQKTTSNILNRFEKSGILKFSKEGKNKYFFLNKFNPSIKEFIKLIELNKKIIFLEKHKKIRTLFDEIEKNTKGILIIYGSYAKESENEKSDIDLFVKEKIKNLEELERMYDIKINVVKAKKIDKNEKIFKEIIKNHIILKGDREFIDEIW